MFTLWVRLMDGTVFVFGAGINKVLKIQSPWAISTKLPPENYKEVTPPLMDDFFSSSFKIRRIRLYKRRI